MKANKFNTEPDHPTHKLSIQQRLPLYICALLLAIVVSFSMAAYYSLKKASISIGKERLRTLTNQLSGILGKSGQFVASQVHETAYNTTIKDYLQVPNDKQFQDSTLNILDKLKRDTNTVSVALLDTNLHPVLQSAKARKIINIDLRKVMAEDHFVPGLTKVGKLYVVNGLIYYATIAAVINKSHPIGYVVVWRSLKATPKAITDLSQLVGTNAAIYIGNQDGSLWTDMIKPVSNLSVNTKNVNDFFTYSNAKGDKMIAAAQVIAATNWVILVEFAEKKVLDGVARFLRLLLIIGGLLIVAGILIAWRISYNITKPLKQLTIAATAIARGDYLMPVEVEGDDELGKLANAFNVMANNVQQHQHELEDKVSERTMQLKTANSELEAFSYSVSHDLRTPLRAINGYSNIFKEDYASKIDEEGNRLIQNIVDGGKMMSKLIDDLLAFSRLGRQELKLTTVDIQLVVDTIIAELLVDKPENQYKITVGSLPPCYGDAALLKQVFMNLIGNAMKYSSKKDDPEIEIGCKMEKGKTIYFVKDNGDGFDMAYSDKLFGVFQRLHTHEEFEGTGIGLSLVKRIINKHGGHIWAEGEKGKGAVFYISFTENNKTE